MSSRSNLHDHYSWDELVTRALKAYKKGRYDEALEALNSAEEGRPGGPDTEILDLKAATLARLEKPELALADARRMLVLDKEYVPGYLRTGRILEGMDKNEVALKIYERGIRFCNKKDSRYETLKAKHADLKLKIAPPEGINFFNVLPVELLDIMFSYLPLEVACKCLRVSKRWKQIMTGWPRFWFHLDLSGAKKPVKPETLMRYVAYSQNGIRTAILKNVGIQGTPLLSRFTGKCQSLDNLTILSGGALKASLVQALSRAGSLKTLTLSNKVPVQAVTLGEIMESCPSLADVCVHGLSLTDLPPGVAVLGNKNRTKLMSWKVTTVGRGHPSLLALSPSATGLKSLSITLETGASFDGLELIAKRYEHLETLALENVPLGIRFHDGFHPVAEDLILPTGLRHLSILLSDILTSRALSSTQNLSQLQSLTLRSVSHPLSLEKVTRLLACDPAHKDPSPLTTFKIWLPLWREEQIQQLLGHPRLTHLQHLGLMDCHDLNDGLVDVIAEQGKDLRSLHLPLSRITGVGLKKLIQSCPLLASVNLDQCTRIGDDALQWARDQGVFVSRKLV